MINSTQLWVGFFSDINELSRNKLGNSSKFLSPSQADGVLRNFIPLGADFANTRNPPSKLKLRGIPFRNIDTVIMGPHLFKHFKINGPTFQRLRLQVYYRQAYTLNR